MTASYIPTQGLGAPILQMETDVNAIPLSATGADYGWVSGTPAGLADGASATCIFDLGPNWTQYPIVQVGVCSVTATSLSNINMFSTNDGITVTSNNARRLAPLGFNSTNATAISATVPTTSAAAILIKPAGRFLHVPVTNTAAGGAQGATAKVVVTMYPR